MSPPRPSIPDPSVPARETIELRRQVVAGACYQVKINALQVMSDGRVTVLRHEITSRILAVGPEGLVEVLDEHGPPRLWIGGRALLPPLELAKLQGVTARYTIDSRGILQGEPILSYATEENELFARSQLALIARQLVPVPEGAVSAGDAWDADAPPPPPILFGRFANLTCAPRYTLQGLERSPDQPVAQLQIECFPQPPPKGPEERKVDARLALEGSARIHLTDRLTSTLSLQLSVFEGDAEGSAKKPSLEAELERTITLHPGGCPERRIEKPATDR